RRTTPPLRSISAMAAVAPRLAGKITSCKAVGRPHPLQQRQQHPVAPHAGLQGDPPPPPRGARPAALFPPTGGHMQWAGVPPTQRAAISLIHSNMIRPLILGQPRQRLTRTTRSTTWLAGSSLTGELLTSTA